MVEVLLFRCHNKTVGYAEVTNALLFRFNTLLQSFCLCPLLSDQQRVFFVFLKLLGLYLHLC